MKTNATMAPFPAGAAPVAEETPKPSAEETPAPAAEETPKPPAEETPAPAAEETPKPKRTRGNSAAKTGAKTGTGRKKAAKANKD